MKFDLPLTKDTFLLYATKNYDNPQCIGASEFNADVKIFMYIKRLLKKYENGKPVDFRLVLNHIITLSNVFGGIATCRMLFFYCDESSFPVLKAVCNYLSILSKNIPEVNLNNLESDPQVLKFLEEL